MSYHRIYKKSDKFDIKVIFDQVKTKYKPWSKIYKFIRNHPLPNDKNNSLIHYDYVYCPQ